MLSRTLMLCLFLSIGGSLLFAQQSVRNRQIFRFVQSDADETPPVSGLCDGAQTRRWNVCRLRLLSGGALELAFLRLTASRLLPGPARLCAM
jgi:hypothetical protein